MVTDNYAHGHKVTQIFWFGHRVMGISVGSQIVSPVAGGSTVRMGVTTPCTFCTYVCRYPDDHGTTLIGGDGDTLSSSDVSRTQADISSSSRVRSDTKSATDIPCNWQCYSDLSIPYHSEDLSKSGVVHTNRTIGSGHMKS